MKRTVCPYCGKIMYDDDDSFRFRCRFCKEYLIDIDKDHCRPEVYYPQERHSGNMKPIAEIVRHTDADGWHKWDKIQFRCPKCRKILRGYKQQDGCKECQIFFDWGNREPEIVTTKTIRW